MAIISRTVGYLFIESPRTGCTALGRGVLLPHLQGVPIPEENVRNADGKVVLGAKHVTIAELLEHGLLTPEDAADLFKFTTVRNPFDSIVSDYVKRRADLHEQIDNPNSWIHRNKRTLDDMIFARDHSFPEWVERRYTRTKGRRVLPVSPRHVNGAQLEGVDHVMRYEALQDEFDGVLRGLGIDERYEIPSIHVTKARAGLDYREFYDDRARAIVAEVFEPDLERFGYDF